ncbi:hypothetical protein B0T20DRAFT_463002 [Sordaria brevicollis]|uniref:Uncharacterized protein n=1 Tax=Sordaria brevicollis TaxID=83679 RepID=A0AAE0UA58_SORBR|nr:hypothetical protein B0T20DRAFT_463002 [Sordaria brevicollis]
MELEVATATIDAGEASEAPLFYHGVPQLKIFGDGSIKGNSEANPCRFLDNPQVSKFQFGVDNNQVFEGSDSYNGPARLADFTVLSLGMKDAFSVPILELAAISQGLETAIRLIDSNQPPISALTIFSDAVQVLNRIKKGFIPKTSLDKQSLWDQMANPLVQTIIWQSHYLEDHGCTVNLAWNPRCCALGPAIADAAAGAFKTWSEDETKCDLWSQQNLHPESRDGILDKWSEEMKELIRCYKG